MINSCDKQSNAFDRSVSSTSNAFSLSTDDFHFSNIANKQFYALKPLRNPHWYFDSNGFVKSVIYLLIIFSKIFEIIGKILTSQEPFLKTAAISPFLKIAGNLPLIIVSFKKSQIYAEKISAFSFNISLVGFLAFNLLISLKTSSASVIFSFDFDSSESNCLTVLQNGLLSAMSL